MGALIEVLQAFFERYAGKIFFQLILQLLAMLGMALVSYKFAVGPLFDHIKSLFTGMPAQAFAWVGFLKIDVAMTIIGSAYGMRMARKALHLVKKS